VQVGEQVIELLLVQGTTEGGHQVVPVQDNGRDAVVIRGRAAGQVFLFVERLQAGTVQRAIGVGIVAARTVRLVDLVSGGFLGSEFV